MKIIAQNPGPGGAYPPIQTGDFFDVPPGMALWPDTLPTDDIYAYNGFVELSVREDAGVLTVTGCTPNMAAWEAWKAGQPVGPEEPDRPQSDIDLMAAAYREGVMGA